MHGSFNCAVTTESKTKLDSLDNFGNSAMLLEFHLYEYNPVTRKKSVKTATGI